MKNFKMHHLYVAIILIVGLSEMFYGQQSSVLLQREAERHYKAGRYGEAINLLTELIKNDPNSLDAFILRGRCFVKRSQLKLAVDDFKSASRINPSDAKILEELQNTEKSWTENINQEIDQIEKELILRPNLYSRYPTLAELYYEKGEVGKTISLYKTYTENAEPSFEIIQRYGELLANSNKLKEGRDVFEIYAKRYPDNQMVNLKNGYFNLWLGNFNQAENIFTEILRKNPQSKEAQDGFRQAKSRGYYNSKKEIKKTVVTAGVVNPVAKRIEDYKSKLTTSPKDYRTRSKMVDDLLKLDRYEESFDQLQIMIKDTISIPRFSIYRKSLENKRDSIFQIIVDNYQTKLENNPTQKDLASRLADYYATMNDYENSMRILANYFNLNDGIDGDDLRYRYAQYASWLGKFDEASNQLDFLLFQDPEDLKYQQLKGQILIWSNQHLDLAERYFENNLKAGNQSIDIILGLATLYIQKRNIPEAEKYIDWAKSIDPTNKELKSVETLYANYQKDIKAKRIYSLIEEGRDFAKREEYDNAIIKFDEYFSATKKPSESEFLEYADLYLRLNNFDKAVEVYDQILQEQYSYKVALQRAKVLLWSKKYNEAISEFQDLSLQNPDDYESKVLLGEAYQNLKQFSMANSIYNNVLSNSKDEKIIEMVNDRMTYMPKSGFTNMFSNFPSPIGFIPNVIYYSDNQDFAMNNIGGRLEIGISKFLYGGVSYSEINMYSSNDQRKFVNFKGNLFLKIIEGLFLSGSMGAINTINQPRRNNSAAVLSFGDNNVFSTQVSFEHTDAALVLNSPYLLNLRYNADIYKFAGSFEKNEKFRLSGYFSYISITDGNVGNDFQLRIGSKLLDDTYFGYESRYTSYKYDSPFVPYSHMTLRLYYSPQNLDAHSLWAEWSYEQTENLNLKFGAQVGYIPNYNVVLREIEGKIEYNPYSNLILNLEVTAGSSFRYESSYNFFSGALSLYWRVY